MNTYKQKAFTLIELLVVIAIIGVLASVVLSSLNSARQKAKLAKVRADFKNTETALNAYFNEYGSFPPRGSSIGGAGWNISTGDFIPALKSAGFLDTDTLSNGDTSLYYLAYYKYSAGQYCPSSKGGYYILEIRKKDSTASNLSDTYDWGTLNGCSITWLSSNYTDNGVVSRVIYASGQFDQ